MSVQVKSKVKSVLIIFFGIMGIIPEDFHPTDKTIDPAYCCDVLRRLLKNVRRLRLELWRQKNWLLHHDNAPPHTSIFDQNQHDCLPSPTPLFSIFS
jgi:hypothetical protein